MNCQTPFRMVLILGTLLTLTSTGCSLPGFQHPLVTAEQAQPPLELVGTFKRLATQNDEEWFMKIEPAGKLFPPGLMKASEIGPGNDTGALDNDILFFTSMIDDTYIVHVPMPWSAVDDEGVIYRTFSSKWQPEMVEGFLMYAVRETENGFLLFDLSSEVIEERVKNQSLKGRIKEPVVRPVRRGRHRKQKDLPPKPRVIEEPSAFDQYDILITEKPEQLRKFFESNLDKLMVDEPGRFERVK